MGAPYVAVPEVLDSVSGSELKFEVLGSLCRESVGVVWSLSFCLASACRA